MPASAWSGLLLQWEKSRIDVTPASSASSGADVIAGVDVVGRVLGRDVHADPAEVLHQGPVGADRAQDRLPCVAVRVDESRHHHHAARIDPIGAGRVDRAGHLGDPVPLHEHAAALELADRIVHREHVAVLDEKAAWIHARSIAPGSTTGLQGWL